jgi:type IV pilus assembly protein PilC
MAALSCPMVVMVMAFGTVLVLAGYVLPQFKPLFEELDADLWFVTVAFFVLQIAVVLFFVKTEQGKLLRDRLVLKIPIVSGIVYYAILERFCRILGAMVRAGVLLPEGLKTTTDAPSNSVYKERLEVARAQMLEGKGFSQPLIDTELLPGAAKQMFKVGEETGTLDE